jgi:DNA-binding transcriptional regulator YhcF (GntR family)
LASRKESFRVTTAEQLKQTLSVLRPVGSLRTQAVDKLRQAIIDGHFAPGTRLTERELCGLLGVSRTLVREALRQLEAEGWVENVPYRGPIVATISADEARQLYQRIVWNETPLYGPWSGWRMIGTRLVSPDGEWVAPHTLRRMLWRHARMFEDLGPRR